MLVGAAVLLPPSTTELDPSVERERERVNERMSECVSE